MTVRILHGDCLALLPTLEADSIDSCVTDPPYAIRFMGKGWDDDVALRHETWETVFRVLKPGAYLLAFGGTRTFHRMACAIEDAGFEIRDTCAWLYASGFPKSLDVSKAIDKAAGATRTVIGMKQYGEGATYGVQPAGSRTGGGIMGEAAERGPSLETAPATPEAAQWQGWGTALKPAFEPIIVARKPLGERTVAANVLQHGTGALNIDACRVPLATGDITGRGQYESKGWKNTSGMTGSFTDDWKKGRFPANVLHDGSDEVEAAFAAYGSKRSAGDYPSDGIGTGQGVTYMPAKSQGQLYSDSGTASRFFYTAKADSGDRAGSKHPTVKPTDLMRWLVRLVTPPGGTVLDPFCGTGSTLLAADQQQFHAIGIEQDATYAADARRKFERDAGMFAEVSHG
jgi:site-specific DNA-methyltransferase (adenine-specific)